MLILLGCLLAVCSYLDIKEQQVPTILLVISSIFSLGWIFITRQYGDYNKLAGVGIGLFLLLIGKVFQDSIGIGDGILLCITGAILGFWENMMMLFYGCLFAAFFVLLFRKKNQYTKKSQVPFIPFLFLSYLGGCFIW